MNRYLILIVLFFSLFQIDSKACLNYFYTVDSEGNLHAESDVRKGFNTNFNKELIVSRLKTLEARLAKEHSYSLLSDYAILLLKLGKNKESLAILSTLYSNYPRDYRIASNLGTAYELNGEPDSALKYIKKGLILNPMDHEGSEWVHVKVLETKLKLKNDKNYLDNHTVLELTDLQEKDTMVAKHINIQVRERFPFSPGPDAIMASLLIDLGDCYSNTASIEFAKAVYQLARDYYGASEEMVNNKIKSVQNLINKYKAVKPGPEYRNHTEGDHVRLESISSKGLLDNNDKNNYKVDWSAINTNVDSLLAMIDLTLPPVKQEENLIIADSALLDSSKNNNAHLSVVEKEEKNGASYLIFYILSGGAALLAGVFLVRGRK